MSDRNRERIDALDAFERQAREESRRAREQPGPDLTDLGRILQEADAARAARHRERWRKMREATGPLLTVSAAVLAALLGWWLLFR